MAVVLYTVIGDLVGSRDLPDRGAAQTELADVLARVNAVVPAAQRLEPTMGDEYQGAFTTLGGATRASLLVRLLLLPTVDIRCGLGHGEVSVHDEERRPLLQDGPGWWSARDAIDHLEQRRRQRRSWYVGPGDELANAFLVCRDQLVDRLNDRGRHILSLALSGHSQKEIAALEHVTASAVSQQFARGVGAIMEAQDMLEGDVA